MSVQEVKAFIAKHDVFGTETEFTEVSAPEWLTCRSSVKGSTMDNSWFWRDYVFPLLIGQSVKTDFHTITRTK